VIISITSSRVTAEQADQVEGFLAGFLPRLKEQPGVVDVFHFMRPDAAESTTIIIWANDEARLAYRESELIKEPLALEESLGLSSAREAYPLTFPPGSD
jgi:heme-degrading monooxygenase HmoA